MDTAHKKSIINKCKASCTFFIENFCKVKHTNAGILPFKLFKYQKESLKAFKKHRFNLYKKNRQSGISALTGSYALWFAMFHSHKTILIVSKRDTDAITYMANYVKLVYSNLPPWMQSIWGTDQDNMHQMTFNNGSIIKSLTSSKDTLRSNASSLNIIDEAAFIKDMDAMWAAGYPTLQHGGRVIVISTSNGAAGWYYQTWMDAKSGNNDFNPIEINWWDMDWELEWVDSITGKKVRLAPCDGIRPTRNKQEFEKYGPYYSPWLENEYRNLSHRGQAHKFKQEILAEFIGSGGTVLSSMALYNLNHVVSQASKPSKIVNPLEWNNPITGELELIDITPTSDDSGLYIWNEPIRSTKKIMLGSKTLRDGSHGHQYSIGVDTATDSNGDYHGIEVFDIDTQEQVAEYMNHGQVTQLCKIVDFLGRYYNNAVVCVERTGIGASTIEGLCNLLYPNLWRKETITPNGSRPGQYGFSTTGASKPALNKLLVECLSENEGEGYLIKSKRLLDQLHIYIRMRDSRGFDTSKTGAQSGRGNHDDLVIASALSFLAASTFKPSDTSYLIPYHGNKIQGDFIPTSTVERVEYQKTIMPRTDPALMMPFSNNTIAKQATNFETDLNNFSIQLINHPKPQQEAVRQNKLKDVIDHLRKMK